MTQKFLSVKLLCNKIQFLVKSTPQNLPPPKDRHVARAGTCTSITIFFLFLEILLLVVARLRGRHLYLHFVTISFLFLETLVLVVAFFHLRLLNLSIKIDCIQSETFSPDSVSDIFSTAAAFSGNQCMLLENLHPPLG